MGEDLSEIKAENAEIKRQMAQLVASLQKLEALTANVEKVEERGISKLSMK